VHLVEHSFGGLSLYATVLAGKVKPLSIVTFEGNPVYCKRGDEPIAWLDAMVDMKARFKAAIEANDPEAAGVIIDFWSFAANFKSMPDSFRAFCQTKAATNLLDWEAGSNFTAEFAQFGCLDMPCTVSRGELANQAMIDTSDQIVAHAQKAVLRPSRVKRKSLDFN